MKFKELALYLQNLEKISSRNQIIVLLSDLFKKSLEEEIDKICYLSLGRIAPYYESLEFNIADKLMLQIIERAYRIDKQKVKKMYSDLGDLGELVFKVAKEGKLKKEQELSVRVVYNSLKTIALVEGKGSVEDKIVSFSALLNQLDPLSAKYLVRVPLGRVRLGFSEMTILDSLSWMLKGDKTLRSQIEDAYNKCADIGKVATFLKKKGISGLTKIEIQTGVPIRVSTAERLPTAEDILKKIKIGSAEPKLDGFRMQVHFDKTKRANDNNPSLSLFEKDEFLIKIFSRNLEDITRMSPEIVESVLSLDCQQAIFEGEAIAYDPKNNKFLSFQETIQRKRKYGISEIAQRIPLRLFCFDLLYKDGKSFLEKPYVYRREVLEKMIGSSCDSLKMIESKIIKTSSELESYFLEQIKKGLEGVVVKKLDAKYEAGSRGFHWIKYKREEDGKLDDTIDCVILGYYFGKGNRVDFGIGAFLVGVYDDENDSFKTIAKIGTGLTDQEWKDLKLDGEKLKLKQKPSRVEVHKDLSPDIWIEPKIIVVVRADEITQSPIHTAGKNTNQTGYALRFPRVIEFGRKDKKPEDITTVKEIIYLYQNQKRSLKKPKKN